MEMAVHYSRDRVMWFECVGDNAYRLKDTFDIGSEAMVQEAVSHDLDQDGRPELVIMGDVPVAHFFEMCGDDSFRYVANCTTACDITTYQGCAVVCTPDMDRDGWPEAVTYSRGFDNSGVLAVIEATGSDRFAVVWDTTFAGPYFGRQALAVGDIDSDEVSEFAVEDGESLRVFRCVGDNLYQQIWASEAWEEDMGFADLNCDGRDELLVRRTPVTVIYEYASAGISEQTRRRLEQVIVRPTVVGRGGKVRIAGMANDESSPRPSPYHGEGGRRPGEDGGVRIEVVDVAGRTIVALPADCRTGQAEWDTRGVVLGAYFIRVSSQGQSITHKVLILPR